LISLLEFTSAGFH